MKFVSRAMLLSCAFAATTNAASAATIVSAFNRYSNLGATSSGTSPYDQVTFSSKSNNVTGSADIDFSGVIFLTGPTGSGSNGTYNGSFSNVLSIDGKNYAYVVPYILTIGSTDAITIGGNNFSVGGFSFNVSSLTLTATSSTQTLTGSLRAKVTSAVPEPATWAMMILGFGIVGSALRRRKGATAVRYA